MRREEKGKGGEGKGMNRRRKKNSSVAGIDGVMI